jgi:putative thioredoxin
MSGFAKEVTDQTFVTDVVERSKQVPVVVDLWAPWCAPCRALAPILERVAADADGSFDLVKVNVDENPVSAGKLGARSIPLVIGFKDGEPVSSFVGVQPESAIRRFVAALLPSEVDRMVEDAIRARGQGRLDDAERILEAALDDNPRHDKARLALAELLGDQGRPNEALDVLAKADPAPEVEQLRSSLRLAASADLDLDELRVSAAAGDLGAAVMLGNALAAQGDTESALDVLLAAVKAEPAGKKGAARQAMLDVFNVLGNDDPLVRRYRARLAQALF